MLDKCDNVAISGVLWSADEMMMWIDFFFLFEVPFCAVTNLGQFADNETSCCQCERSRPCAGARCQLQATGPMFTLYLGTENFVGLVNLNL